MRSIPGQQILLSLTILIVLALNQDTVAQQLDIFQEAEQTAEPDLDLVKESRTVFKKEVQPLQDKISKQSIKIQRRESLEAHFVNSLKTVDDESLARVRKEMQELAERLEMLERLENVLTDMNPDAIDNAIADGESRQEELRQLRRASSKPMQAEIALLQQEYSHKNDALAKTARHFFKEHGTDDFKGLKRKYGNANFAFAQYTCGYDNKENKSAFSISLHFQPQVSLSHREFEKLDDKHIIYQWTDSNLMLLVNGSMISCYDTANKMDKAKIMEAVKHFVDIEKLDSFQQ